MRKKLFSVLLSLAMVVAMIPMSTMTAFAGRKLNYSYMGDSMTYNFATDRHGYSSNLKETYPEILAKEFGLDTADSTEGPQRDFLCGGGRSTDMYALLSDYDGDDYTRESYSGGFSQERKNVAIELIRKSDVITLQLGHSNISVYALQNLVSLVSGGGYEGASFFDTDLAQLCDSKAMKTELASSKTVANNMLDLAGAKYANSWEKFVDANLTKQQKASINSEELGELKDVFNTLGKAKDTLVYAYASAVVHFDKLVMRIHKINPRAEVYVIGLFNPVENMTLSYKVLGKAHVIKLGECVGISFDAMNAHMKRFAALDLKCHYIAPPKNVQTFADLYATSESDAEEFLLALWNDSIDDATPEMQDKAAMYAPAVMKIAGTRDINLNKVFMSLPLDLSKVGDEISNLAKGEGLEEALATNKCGKMTARYYLRVLAGAYLYSARNGLFVHPTQEGHNTMAANIKPYFSRLRGRS